MEKPCGTIDHYISTEPTNLLSKEHQLYGRKVNFSPHSSAVYTVVVQAGEGGDNLKPLLPSHRI